MTTSQIELVFPKVDSFPEEEIFNEMFQELKDEQTVHLVDALNSLN